MVWVAMGLLALWLAGLTAYVVLMALRPVPVEDVQQALRRIAEARVRHALRTRAGKDALRAARARRQQQQTAAS